MRIASVFRWTILLLVGGLLSAAAAGFWFLHQWDNFVRAQLLQRFAVHAPQLTLQFDELELPGTSRLVIHDLQIQDRATGAVLLRVNRLQAGIDESLLVERQKLLIRSLDLDGVELHLTRRLNGTWNWQDYRFRSATEGPLIPPVVRVQNLATRVSLEHGSELAAQEFQVLAPRFEAVPSSRTVYQFLGAMSLPGAGLLTLEGGCDLAERSWSIAGAVSDVSADDKLLLAAEQTIPQFSDRIAELDAALAALIPADGVANDPESATGDGAVRLGRGRSSLRFTGRLDAGFRAERGADAAVPVVNFRLSLRDGTLSSPGFPLQLQGIRAGVSVDNSLVDVRLEHAGDGVASISGWYQTSLSNATTPATAGVRVENFPVGMQWRPFFPQKAQRFLDQFHPQGTVDGVIEVKQQPAGRWLLTDCDMSTKNGQLQFHRFAYRVEDIDGRLRIRKPESEPVGPEEVYLDLEGSGLMGGTVVAAGGWMRNPGELVELEIQLDSDPVPIDGRFRDALDEKARRVLDALDISGQATAELRCRREPGLDQPTRMLLTAKLQDTRIRLRTFQWQVEQISGELRFDSLDGDWEFIGLRGRHGEAQLEAAGKFRAQPAPGDLQLTIRVQNGSLDTDLFNALNESGRAVWRVINPEGRVNLTTDVSWTAAPGSAAKVRLQDVEVYDAVIYPRPFPYRMRINSARLSFAPNDPRFAGRQHCEIHDLRASHEGAPITAGGWADVNADGEWQVHLNRVNANQLRPDDQLRAALPTGWRQTLSRLGQQGRVSLVDSEVDFRGRVDNSVAPTAAWRLDFRLDDCAVAAGLDLTEVNGRVRARGTWDGAHLQTRGDMDLRQLKVLDMLVEKIEGPWTLTGNELVVGNRDVILGLSPEGDVATAQRLRAKAFGGELSLDGRIDMQAGSQFRFFGELRNADLETYAREYAPSQRNLNGKVGAWMFLEGEGEDAADVRGRGQIQITEAALYEIPVVLELISALSQLNFNVPNRSAFNQALASFQIVDEAFQMGPIDLAGEALSLRGYGRIGFAGDLELDFFSRPPGLKFGRNPITDILLQGATQWVNVQVRGTTSRPQTRVSNRPQLDEQLRRALDTFNARPGVPLPGLSIPLPPLLP